MASDASPYIYKPTWVANTFLLRAKNERVEDIDPLKIQKLVYNFHGWHLATTGMPALGESFEAWPMGPVLSSLYHKFKQYRSNPIRDYAKDIDPLTGREEAGIIAPSDEEFHKVFNAVWDRYKGYSGIELSAFTHAPGTPWSKARQASAQYISNEAIKDHFLALGKQAA